MIASTTGIYSEVVPIFERKGCTIVLDGKVIVITGASKGMGRATARLCAEQGASVVLADLDADGLKSIALEITSAGGAALARVTDVTSEEDVRALFEVAVSRFDTVHVLHNNAYAVHPGASRDLISTSLESWEWTLRTCLTSQFLCCRAAIPLMLEAGGGSIINVSSGNGLSGSTGAAAYGAAKAGTIVLTKYLATQYGKQNIRANTIVPGWTIETGWTGPVAAMSKEGLDLLDRALEDVCMPRLAYPDDIAAVVAFLASDEARYVQAATIEVNGGLLAHMAGAAGKPAAPPVSSTVNR